MDDDGLSVFDLESVVLTGDIVERQRDRETREQKYVIRGAERSQGPLRRSSPNSGQPAARSSSRSISSSPLDICAFCGRRGVTTRLVTRSFGRGRSLLVIERIPLLSCPHCGQSYFTAETLHEVERIRTHRNSLAEQRQVAVAAFR